MLIESGGKIYETNFREPDLEMFYVYGAPKTNPVEQINDGALWLWNNPQKQQNPYVPGSQRALVEVSITQLSSILTMKTVKKEEVKVQRRELPQ